MKTPETDSSRKTAVITGASSGIGRVVACELASQGWYVIGLGRDIERARCAMAAIQSVSMAARADMVLADLSSMVDTARAAREIVGLTGRVDLLVNNAGGISADRKLSVDGFEHTFASNHLGPFLFTRELLPLIRAAGAGAQIINVASIAHRFIKDMIWNDLQQAQKFDAGDAYAQSKLANILFTRALAKRLSDNGICANAVHPGLIHSNFWRGGNLLVRAIYRLARPFSLTPEQGADTILWLVTEANACSGGYFAKRKPARMTPAAQSDEGAERLWNISEQLLATVNGLEDAGVP